MLTSIYKVSQAIVSQKRTILSHEKWKTIPWEDNPSSKQPFDFLVDILCDIADYRSDLKAVRQTHEDTKRVKLKERALTSLDSLDNWWLMWARENQGAWWEVKTNPDATLLDDSSGPLYPTILEYSCVWVAYTVCTYDAARIMLLDTLTSLGNANEFVLPGLVENDSGCLAGISSESTSLAHEILRSIEFCSRQSSYFMGSFSVILILDIAYGALKKGSRESRWLLGNGMVDFEPINSPGKEDTGVKMLSSCQIAGKARLLGF